LLFNQCQRVAGTGKAALAACLLAKLSGQCFQGSCQTALVASCLVFVDDLLVSDAVDGRHGSWKMVAAAALSPAWIALRQL
jgi:hypothetical protein